jgi:uncharacterized protein (DUF2252 family)
MSLSETIERPCAPPGLANPDVAEAADRLTSSLEAMIAAGRANDVPDAALRQVMAALIKVYATKFDQGERPPLLDADAGVSATAVLVATSALLKASNLEIFELGMWQSWSGSR